MVFVPSDTTTPPHTHTHKRAEHRQRLRVHAGAWTVSYCPLMGRGRDGERTGQRRERQEREGGRGAKRPQSKGLVEGEGGRRVWEVDGDASPMSNPIPWPC